MADGFGKPPWSFALIPSYDADPRSLRDLGRGELACWLAIARCMNGNTYEACPSMETIGRIAGMNTRNAGKHVASLIAQGWIESTPGGGRSKTNLYRFVVPETDGPETLSPERQGIETRNPVGSEPETLSVSNRNPVGSERKPCRPQDRRTTEQHRTTSNSRAPAQTEQPPTGAGGVAAAEGAGAEVKADPETSRELQRFGVRDPERARLARAPGITPELVRRIGEDCTKRGKGPGVLVIELRAAIVRKRNGEAVEQSPRPGEGIEHARKEKTMRSEEDRRIEQQTTEDESWANDSEDAELVGAYDRMIARCPNKVGVCLRPPDGYSIQEKAAFIRAHLSVEVHGFVLEEQRQAPESP